MAACGPTATVLAAYEPTGAVIGSKSLTGAARLCALLIPMSNGID